MSTRKMQDMCALPRRSPPGHHERRINTPAVLLQREPPPHRRGRRTGTIILTRTFEPLQKCPCAASVTVVSALNHVQAHRGSEAGVQSNILQ
ncbi:hypothetical protein SRHO_G00135050 [Serrasalmus rhombeus]